MAKRVYGKWLVITGLMAGAFMACSSGDDDDDDDPGVAGGGSGGRGGNATAGKNTAGKNTAGKNTAGAQPHLGGGGQGGAGGANEGGGGVGGCSIEDECGGCSVGAYTVICSAGPVWAGDPFDISDGAAACAAARAANGEGGAGGIGGAGGQSSGGETSTAVGGAGADICQTYVEPGERITGCGQCTETETERKRGECRIDGECCVVVYGWSCGV